MKANEKTVEAILEMKPTETKKRIEIISWYHTKDGKLLTEAFETDRSFQKSSKKRWTMERGDERGKNLGKLTQMLSEWPCSAYYAKDKHEIVTTDATTTELQCDRNNMMETQNQWHRTVDIQMKP